MQFDDTLSRTAMLTLIDIDDIHWQILSLLIYLFNTHFIIYFTIIYVLFARNN